MNIETAKLELIQWLLNVRDEATIKKISSIREKQHISVNNYNKELDQAEKEIQNGEFYVHQEAVNKIQEWREK